MKLLFISLFILFSSSALSQIEKNSDDNFINLTNEIKDDEKLSNKVEKRRDAVPKQLGNSPGRSRQKSKTSVPKTVPSKVPTKSRKS